MKEIKKLLLILDRKDKKSLFILATLLLISLFFEILGIGIIVPIISFFLEGENFLPAIISFSKIDKDDFILYLTLFVILIYILKTIFFMALTLKSNRFIYTLSAKVSNKIFSNILNQEYFEFISKNSSEYVKTLQNEMSIFTAFLVYLLTLIVEGLFIVIILFTIVIIEPTGTLINIFILGMSSILFLIFFDKKLKFWGQKREEMDKKLFLILNSTFGGIKEITLLNRKLFFKNYYSLNNFIRARVASNNQAVSQFPRVFLEFIAVFSIITFVIILKFLGYGNELIITKLSVFAFASFKILPSTSKIINAIQHLKYYSPSVEIIYRESVNTINDVHVIKEIKAENKFNSLLIKNLLFYYNKENILFKNFSFKIKKGDWVGVIGPSGSGKSTLIDLISGLIKPISGEILIDNVNISKISNKEKFYSYVPQNIFLSDDSIINNIALGIEKEKIDIDRINKVIKECELEQKILNLPNGLHTKVGERGVNLSGGQLQRIGIARALYTCPKILILDEATSALDLETETKILNTLKNINKSVTILMIAHRKETLINCNSIIDLNDLNSKK